MKINITNGKNKLAWHAYSLSYIISNFPNMTMPLQIVYFVQHDVTVSFMTLYPIQ